MREPRPDRTAEPGRPNPGGAPQRPGDGAGHQQLDGVRLPQEMVHPQVQELLAQVAEAVRALNRLVATLEETLARPPVHLQVERLEVQTLAFHLGDIDVEELQGELNIGITHSVRLQPPGRDAGAPPPGDRPARRPGDGPGHSEQDGSASGGPSSGGRAQDGSAQGERPPGERAQGGQGHDGHAQGGPAHGQPPRGTLRNSVITRRLALMDPDTTASLATAPPGALPAAGRPSDSQSTPRSASETAHESSPAPDPGSQPLRRVQVWPPPKSEGSAADDKGTP